MFLETVHYRTEENRPIVVYRRRPQGSYIERPEDLLEAVRVFFSDYPDCRYLGEIHLAPSSRECGGSSFVTLVELGVSDLDSDQCYVLQVYRIPGAADGVGCRAELMLGSRRRTCDSPKSVVSMMRAVEAYRGLSSYLRLAD